MAGSKSIGTLGWIPRIPWIPRLGLFFDASNRRAQRVHRLLFLQFHLQKLLFVVVQLRESQEEQSYFQLVLKEFAQTECVSVQVLAAWLRSFEKTPVTRSIQRSTLLLGRHRSELRGKIHFTHQKRGFALLFLHYQSGLSRTPTQLHQFLVLSCELLQFPLRLLRLLVPLHHFAEQHVAHHAELIHRDETRPARAGRGSGARRELAIEACNLGGEDRFVLV